MRGSSPKERTRRLPSAILLSGILGAVLGILVSGTGFWTRLEARTEDARYAIRGPRPTDTKIVIVGIGDRSDREWTEPKIFWQSRYAEVIKKIAEQNPKWLGFDLIVEADAGTVLYPLIADGVRMESILPLTGLQLIRELGELSEKSTLAYVDSDEPKIGKPVPALAEAFSDTGNLGFVNLPQGTDAAVRAMPLFAENSGKPLPSFSASIAARASKSDPNSATDLLKLVRSPFTQGDLTRFRINFLGAPIETIDAVDVLEGRVNRSQIENAIVLIGVTDRLSQDRYDVPSQLSQMHGVEIHANAVATLLDHCDLKRFPPNGELVIGLVLGLIAAVLVAAFSPVVSVVSILGICAAWAMAVQFGFDKQNLLLPVAGPATSILLSTTFAFVGKGLAEARQRLQIEAVFGRYVSPEIRDFLLANPDRLQLGGELQEVTIVFLDIRDSVGMGEGLDPKEFMSELNEFFATIVPELDRHGGLLYRYTGDGFLSVFGAPRPLKNHAQSAVDSCIDIVASVAKLNTTRLSKGKRPFRIGCGAHTGNVLCGNLGVQSRAEFTVIGDDVNAAARIEGYSKELKCSIVASDQTISRLDNPPEIDGPYLITLRGRSEPTPLYRVSANTEKL